MGVWVSVRVCCFGGGRGSALLLFFLVSCFLVCWGMQGRFCCGSQGRLVLRPFRLVILGFL